MSTISYALLSRANGCCATHRKRPAYNFIAYAYLKEFFAIDARNPLLNHLCNAGFVGDVNFLVGFTVLTLDGHGDKRLVKQRRSPGQLRTGMYSTTVSRYAG
jgi:hypothetical protein